ncbi:MAG TPA: hypothetical protein VLV49_17850 [Terriglobales bacterium]|nr:hypothetical protein [Terriglobales bacterium]
MSIWRVVLVGWLFLAAGSSQERERSLVGNWRSVVTSKGGIGSLLQFREDGSLDYSPGAIVPGRFRLEGKRLTCTVIEGDGTQTEQAMTIVSQSANALKLEILKGAPAIDLKRVGQPEDARNPILGTWVTVKPMPDMPAPMYAYYRFHGDGTETFSIPFKWTHGRYSVNGEQIRYSLPGQAVVEGALGWDGDAMVLPKAQGETKFKRY